MVKKIIFAVIVLAVLAFVMYSCVTSANRAELPPGVGADVPSEGGETAGGEAVPPPPPSTDGVVDDGIVGILPEGEGDDADVDAGTDAVAGAVADAGTEADGAGEVADAAKDADKESGKDQSDKKKVVSSFTSLRSESGWYLSNGGGMLLEKTFQARALRSTYAIQILNVKPENVPKEIAKYYSATWKIECRVLYHEGRRVRTQWVYKDFGMNTLFIASIGEDGSGFLEWYDDKAYVVEEQRLSADGSGLFISYTYSGHYLLKAEAIAVAPVIKIEPKQIDEGVPAGAEDAGAVAGTVADGAAAPAGEGTDAADTTAAETDAAADTPNADTNVGEAVANAESGGENATAAGDAPADTPQASAPETPPPPPARSRADLVKNPDGPAKIPEFYIAATGRETGKLWTDNYRYTRAKSLRAVERINYAVNEDVKIARLTFPRFVADSEEDKNFILPGNSISSRFLLDIMEGSAKVTYTLDGKKRILLETHRDEDENVIGELINTWEGDRIKSVKWDSQNDKRLIEYVYNTKGDRIIERDYKNDVLERLVEINGNTENETLYYDNKVVLRAVWESGMKISETRVH